MDLTSVGPRDARQHEGAPRSPVVPSGTATSTGSAHLLPHGQHAQWAKLVKNRNKPRTFFHQ